MPRYGPPFEYVVLYSARTAGQSPLQVQLEKLSGRIAVSPAARKTIVEEKRQALAELRSQTVDLAIEAASRLVQMNLDETKQKQLVEEFLSQLPKETRV